MIVSSSSFSVEHPSKNLMKALGPCQKDSPRMSHVFREPRGASRQDPPAQPEGPGLLRHPSRSRALRGEPGTRRTRGGMGRGPGRSPQYTPLPQSGWESRARDGYRCLSCPHRAVHRPHRRLQMSSLPFPLGDRDWGPILNHTCSRCPEWHLPRQLLPSSGDCT